MLGFIVLFPIFSAFVSYLIGKKHKDARNIFAMIVTITNFILVLTLINNPQSYDINDVMVMGLHFKVEGLHLVLALLASFIWMITTIFSREYFAHYRNRNRYYFFMLMTLGATLGVFLSADFFTCFFFFEVMSFTSFVLVIHDESSEAIRAAKTYLTVAIFGGLVTLMGLIMLYSKTNTLFYSDLINYMALNNDPSIYVIGVLILTGFAAKAGLFPLHIWLPVAHPVAPAPASALLSAILTKSGIFGMIMLSVNIFMHDLNWGMFLLVLATITMVLGAVLAVFSTNLKRILACSSLSQIGFVSLGIAMMCCLGEHNALAASGTMLHILNHALIKLVLFCLAGVVYMNLHKLDLNDIKGYGKNKKLLMFLFLVGALSIGGIPGFSGYISKTLLHESIVEMLALVDGNTYIFFKTVEILFLFSGGLTLAYMTKIFVALFIEDNKDQVKMNKTPSMNKLSTIVLVISAIILFVLGITPHVTMDVVANFVSHSLNAHPMHEVAYFSFVNLKGAIISITIAVIVYFGFIRKFLIKDGIYLDVWPKWLNIENAIYRPLLLQILPFIGAMFARIIGSITDFIILIFKKTIFNQDDAIIIPKEDEKVSISALDPSKAVMTNLGKALIFFGLGLLITLMYLLF